MKRKTLLIIMLLALGAPWAMGQQALTVYENEAYNYCTTIPVQGSRVNYDDLKCEYVIPAADIASMNETNIYAMDLYMFAPDDDWGNARFQVFMKEVEETEFDANQPSFYGTENATIVYSGSLDPTGNVMTIPFSSPYAYHGGNLLVGFYITQTGTARNTSFLAKSTSSYWGPTTYPAYQGSNGNYTRQSYLPKTTFVYSSEPVSYLRPRNLAVTGMTSHSVTVSWTNGSNETAWQLVYSDNAQFNPDDAEPIAVSSNPFTLDGLDIGTTYSIYLRADYGDGNYSGWSDMIYVEPLCFVPSNLHADNVTNSSASLSWMAGNDETAWQLVYSSNPAFDPDEAEKIDLTQRNYSIQDLTAETTYYAYVRANCGDSHYSGWSAVCSFTPSNAIDLLAVDGSSTNQYVPMYLSMVDYLPVRSQFIIPAENLQAMQYGQIKKLTFYHFAPNSYYESWGGANFKVYLMETDNTVFGSAAMVDWSQMTEVYDGLANISGGKMEIVLPTVFDYENGNLLVGFNQTATGASAGGSWYGQTSATNTALYGFLSSNTLVKFLPKTTISYFEGTAPSCPKPRNLVASNVTGHSATLSWTPGGDETAWQYVISTDPDFNPDDHNPLTVQSNPFTLSGLTPETTYYVYVRAYCGEGDVSAWSNRCAFMPSMMRTITVNDGTSTSYYAPFYYDASTYNVKSQFIVPAADLEEMVYGQITKLTFYATSVTGLWPDGVFRVYAAPTDLTEFTTATPWSEAVTIVDTPTYTLDDLTPATDYQVRVKADCGSDNTSYWLASGFTTRCAPMSLPFEYNFDSDAAGSGTSLPECWTRVNQGAPTSTYAGHPRIMSSSTNSHSTSNYLEFYKSTSTYGPLYQMAVLPEMDAPISSLVLSFWGKAGATGSNTLAVGVMSDPDDPATFEMVKNVALPTTYMQLTVNFEDYTGSGRYIAFSCDRGSYSRTLYVDDISIVVDLSCKAPKNLEISDLTQTTAMLTWTAVNDITEWELQYRMAESSEWSDAVAVSTNPVYTLNGLTAATEYEARVRTICGTDNYSDWATISFTTECDFLTLPFSYGFEDATVGHNAPACWHFSDGTYPQISIGAANSGTKSLYMNKNSNASFAVLPMVDATEHPINTLQMSFYGKRTTYSVTLPYLYVGVMTDPDDISTYQQVDFISMPSEFTKFDISFENYTGEGQYIVFRCNQSYGYYIDDILVEVAPTCKTPYQLSTNYVEPHEASLMWRVRDEAQMNFQIAYSTTANFNPAEATIVDIDASEGSTSGNYRSGSLTSLDANTTYYYKVRANCGEGDFSAWSEDYGQFTTKEACPVPYAYPNAVGSHSVTFVAMEYDYGTLELRYKKATDDEWSAWSQVEYAGMEDMSSFFVLDNLEESIDYEVEIRANCGEEGYSTGAFPLSFTTLTGCGSTPRTWMCTTHLGTKATVEWFPENDATRWQIRYRIEGQEYAAENMVLTDEITSSPYRWMLTGLETSTVYYWQVRSYCDENTQSDWSEEAWFTTRCSDGFITVDKAHPFFEDFEGADMPDCWDPVNHYDYSMSHLDDWSHITGTNHSWETYNASKCISSDRNHFHFNSNGAAVLAPALYIDENATSATLSFWSKCDFESSDARGTMHIFVSNNINADDGYDFDLGTLWESFGRKSFWRKYVISLDDYIGDTINIRFEYGVTHNYNNYDWLIDDVKVEVFDNVFGEGSDITEGSWDDPSLWRTGSSKAGGGLPTANDNVLINAKVIIPEGFVAEASKIELNIDTVQVDRSGIDKYGSLVIADGGQLVTRNEVEATVQKSITGYGRGGSNWYLIAPPVKETLTPVGDSVTNIVTTESIFDLYSFDGSQQGEEWRNYKQHQQAFKLRNGSGYLVANSVGVTQSFTGTVLPSNQAKTIDLDFAETTFGAWNLVGNPFTCNAYLSDNRSFYRLEETAEGSKIVLAASNVIAPMEGVFVQAADGDDAVTFTTTEPTANANALNFSLRKVEQARGGNSPTGSATLDRARISFGEGPSLGHLDLMADANRLYIPLKGKEMAVVSAQPVGELPLNFEAAENGTFTLSFENAAEDLMYCHLIDNLTGIDIDLLTPVGRPPFKGGRGDSNEPRQAEYTFNAKTSDYASRFRVVFASVCGDANDDNETFAFNNNGQCIILNEGRATLQVIDVAGRILSSEQIEGSVQTQINHPAGLYLLRLVNGDDVKVQKVVVR